jgi:hypothetical protein
MKTLKFLSVLLLLFSAILITSCENEPIDSALLDAIDNGGSGVDGGGGGTSEYYIKVTKDGVVKKWIIVNTLLSNESLIVTSNDGSTSINLSIDDFVGDANLVLFWHKDCLI